MSEQPASLLRHRLYHLNAACRVGVTMEILPLPLRDNP